MSEEKFWLSVNIVIVSGIVLLSSLASFNYYHSWNLAMSYGYQECQAVGNSNTLWKKDCK